MDGELIRANQENSELIPAIDDLTKPELRIKAPQLSHVLGNDSDVVKAFDNIRDRQGNDLSAGLVGVSWAASGSR
jgi:hypothetical protein